ncbi:MAG: pyruvate dehydrogenase component [Baekduia sp.]|nr:pyruvate dehydrogenase component [Baekduia sp.]
MALYHDIDPAETAEWVEALEAVLRNDGPERARELLEQVFADARLRGLHPAGDLSTPYINTIPVEAQPPVPGDHELEHRVRSLVRWNAIATVLAANKESSELGGHIASFQSAATLYEIGFNHFWHAPSDEHGGDLVFIQGHSSPGIYARAFLEGRISEEQMRRFRTETDASAPGLSSYPHPWLMPDFWQFPTVSMGLGPLMAIYQARFMKYLTGRSIADTTDRKVWAFMGDGEMDEPESMGAIGMAGREALDNLIFVVNCNLQRLDGPVRGNGKIIQELETVFRGAGWNVIKVVWGSKWDELLARDVDGVLLNRMNTTVDGEFQKYAVESGAYIRENFFGPDPRLRKMVDHLSDDDLRNLPRGGHDYHKLYAAYQAAVEHTGAPTVILAKTIKGWTLGPEVEARNATHQIKKLNKAQLQLLRDRLYLQDEIPDEALDTDMPPYFRPAEDSVEYRYLVDRRRALDGSIPRRTYRAKPLPAAGDKVFGELLVGSKGQSVSTTMGFARLLRNLLRDEAIGRRVVPIIPDEGRTFGLDALFKEVKIYASGGQRYEPVDADLLLSYAESQQGQILEEGITEAGSMASFTAAGTAYATWSEPMIPFYIFYSMFGFQRVGDSIWAFGDMRGRGFLLGATAGRTTLNGEGLQHEDGHSLVLASTVPNIAAYDPAFAYEVAVVVRDGMARMYGETPQDVFYYLTLYNENYEMPAMAEGVEDGIVRGIYRFAPPPEGPSRKATVLFSGTAYVAATEAQRRLAEEHDVAVSLYSVTSYKALREEAMSTERWNRLHPAEPAKVPFVTEVLGGADGPVVAVSDFMKIVPDQVARWVPHHFSVLGTDGYGRSDTRAALRRHFETDADNVVVAVLKALADTGEGKAEEVADAIARYGINPDAPDPRTA